LKKTAGLPKEKPLYARLFYSYEAEGDGLTAGGAEETHNKMNNNLGADQRGNTDYR
jgi:hypothetical protein